MDSDTAAFEFVNAALEAAVAEHFYAEAETEAARTVGSVMDNAEEEIVSEEVIADVFLIAIATVDADAMVGEALETADAEYTTENLVDRLVGEAIESADAECFAEEFVGEAIESAHAGNLVAEAEDLVNTVMQHVETDTSSNGLPPRV